MDDVTMNIRQSSVDAVITERQLRMVNAKKLKHRRVDVIDLRRIGSVERFVTPLVTKTVSCSTPNSTACQPVRKDERIVVASFSPLSAWHTTKLGRPMDDRVFEHATLLQVGDQCRSTTRHSQCKWTMIARDIFV